MMSLEDLVHCQLNEGLTEQELVGDFGVPRYTFHGILKGRDPKSQEIWKKLARYFYRDMNLLRFGKLPSFLVARDLEDEGIPVNFNSTFSGRQVVAAALLAKVTRTNIFMGRLDQALNAELRGAQVALEAQRTFRRLRQNPGVRTRLIVASLCDWRSFLHTAGCDAYTAECKILRDFLGQNEAIANSISSTKIPRNSGQYRREVGC